MVRKLDLEKSNLRFATAFDGLNWERNVAAKRK